jgi:hypothetical protein
MRGNRAGVVSKPLSLRGLPEGARGNLGFALFVIASLPKGGVAISSFKTKKEIASSLRSSQ